MSREETIEILNKLEPHEITVFIYRNILGLSTHATARARRQKKPTYDYLAEQVEKKITTHDNHQQAIAGLQELFWRCQPDSFFISKRNKL